MDCLALIHVATETRHQGCSAQTDKPVLPPILPRDSKLCRKLLGGIRYSHTATQLRDEEERNRFNKIRRLYFLDSVSSILLFLYLRKHSSYLIMALLFRQCNCCMPVFICNIWICTIFQ